MAHLMLFAGRVGADLALALAAWPPSWLRASCRGRGSFHRHDRRVSGKFTLTHPEALRGLVRLRPAVLAAREARKRQC